jgi:hypothetical protein
VLKNAVLLGGMTAYAMPDIIAISGIVFFCDSKQGKHEFSE